MNISDCSNEQLLLYMAYIICKLNTFKYECYEKFDADELIKFAPCNIDSSKILIEALKRNDEYCITNSLQYNLDKIESLLFKKE